MPQEKRTTEYKTVGKRGKRTIEKTKKAGGRRVNLGASTTTKTTTNKRGVTRTKSVKSGQKLASREGRPNQHLKSVADQGDSYVTKTKTKNGKLVKSKTKAVSRAAASAKDRGMEATAKRDVKKGLKKEARQTKRAAMKKARNLAVGRDVPLPKSKF
tara:strand:+ start:615 stop:1085 length:471 start_codon:yes stop_codon:yes gene_type:complete